MKTTASEALRAPPLPRITGAPAVAVWERGEETDLPHFPRSLERIVHVPENQGNTNFAPVRFCRFSALKTRFLTDSGPVLYVLCISLLRSQGVISGHFPPLGTPALATMIFFRYNKSEKKD